MKKLVLYKCRQVSYIFAYVKTFENLLNNMNDIKSWSMNVVQKHISIFDAFETIDETSTRLK